MKDKDGKAFSLVLVDIPKGLQAEIIETLAESNELEMVMKMDFTEFVSIM